MRDSPLRIFAVFLRLGLTSFGGPVAHLGYFRDEFVTRRRWLTEAAFADLVSLCQILPGPTSSQVGAATGLIRGGVPGLAAAWVGFTVPSAVAMALFGMGLARFGAAAGWVHGLKLVSVAVVAQAVWGMGRTLCPDPTRRILAILAAGAAAWLPGSWGQIAVIAGGASVGWLLYRGKLDGSSSGAPATIPSAAEASALPTSRRLGIAALALFAALLVLLPLASASVDAGALQLVSRFYRTGALVFGGGHVVLPLLKAQLVPGMVGEGDFLAIYGAAQAMPGPLFTVAAGLGAAARTAPAGWLGGALALGAIFLPGLLLVVGVLPFWRHVRRVAGARAALLGVNAAVVGILLAALYDPVFTGSVHTAVDFAVAAAAWVLLRWRPPWLVVLLTAAAGAALA